MRRILTIASLASLLFAVVFFTMIFRQRLKLESARISQDTNLISIHLLSEKFPFDSINDWNRNSLQQAGGNSANLFALNLNPQFIVPGPLLTDSDILYWDVGGHAFYVSNSVSSNAFDGMYSSRKWPDMKSCQEGTPFVLMVRGEPIFIGTFEQLASSQSVTVPVLVAYAARYRRNIYSEDWMEFRITRGYLGDDEGVGPDRRNDPRLVAAVNKLLVKRGQLLPPAPDLQRSNSALIVITNNTSVR